MFEYFQHEEDSIEKLPQEIITSPDDVDNRSNLTKQWSNQSVGLVDNPLFLKSDSGSNVGIEFRSASGRTFTC